MRTDLAAPLTGEELARFQGQLGALLADECRRWTGGQSSALPAEQAEALLESLCCTLQIGPAPGPRWRALLDGDWSAALAAGRDRLRDQTARAYALWQRLCRELPPAANRALLDTLRGIGPFFRRYDLRFAAHEIPCSIDYPLALPDPIPGQGADYLLHWLERLAGENDFLRRFPKEGVRAVLARSCPDWYGLHVNLYAPVAAQALALAALGRDPYALDLEAADLDRLGPLPEGIEDPTLAAFARETSRRAAHLDRAGLAVLFGARG